MVASSRSLFVAEEVPSRSPSAAAASAFFRGDEDALVMMAEQPCSSPAARLKAAARRPGSSDSPPVSPALCAGGVYVAKCYVSVALGYRQRIHI